VFVADRMQRVMAGFDAEWQVVAPVPRPPVALGAYRRLAVLPAEEHVNGVRVHHPRYFHVPGLSLSRHAERMARGCRPVVADLCRGRRAVLDAHYVYPDGAAALAIGRDLGVPCVVTARGTDVNVLAQRRSVAAQLRALLPGAAALLAVSTPLGEALAAAAGLPAARVELARNGVDGELFAPGDRVLARRELGLPAEVRIVLGVGRLVKGKRFLDLLRAVAELPDVHTALVGDGPERERLRSAAPAGRLTLLGERTRREVATAYRAADVLALPSEREGWPNVVTEALASGLPVVATAVGGVPRILTDPRCGRLVPVGDVAALARELRALLDDPPDPASVAAFAARFSWDEPVGVVRRALARALA
jgi:glycosyltransferase involved in cell wall biosynthesis